MLMEKPENAYTFNDPQNCLKIRYRNVVKFITSAGAAKRFRNRKIAHLPFRVSFLDGNEDKCYVSANLNDSRKPRDVPLLIWDEILLFHFQGVGALGCTYGETMLNYISFVWKMVLFSERFCEIFSVSLSAFKAHIFFAYVHSFGRFQSFWRVRVSNSMSLQPVI